MLRLVRKHYGAILVIGGLCAFILGIIGFRTCSPGLSLDTVIYRTVQLFYWGYSPWDAAQELPLPWMLAVARWLAPVVLLGALFGVALSFFHRQWTVLMARTRRGHTLVCGGGEKGAVLGGSLRRKGHQVVILERDQERVDLLSEQGFLAVHGDATEVGALRRAGLSGASRLVAVTGDDHDNLAISVAAAQAVEGRSGLSIFLHSADSSLCDLYQRNRALAASLGGVPVRVFNHYRNVARRTLQDFPLDPREDGRAHLVVPGLSRVSLALIVEYALVGHFPGERRTHICLVSPEASKEVGKLRVKYPAVDQCAELSVLDLHESERFSTCVAAWVKAQPPSDCFSICPGTEDDNEAFGHALELNEMLGDHPAVRLLLDTPPGAAIRRLVEGNGELRRRISFLPSGEPASGYEAVIGESLDRTARAIHENWLEETQTQITAARASGNEELARKHEAKKTYRPWDQLNEEQKGASRSQADHIPFKVRALGLDPATVRRSDWEKLTAEQVELLARLEHVRWAAYLWMTGWTFAPERNDSKKQHPNLVPYDDLDEPTKDYDREAVRHLGEYLPR